MRFFKDLDEVISEVTRDLKELAVVYPSFSVQDKKVDQDPGYMTHELMNYAYTIPSVVPDYQRWPEYPYIEAEFMERTDGLSHNPGAAWTYDERYWEEFLNDDGEFDYTYAERMYRWLPFIDGILSTDNYSRRAWLSIWDSSKDLLHSRQGIHYERVPCSLGYFFSYRNGKLHCHYVMRSCDFHKHFRKDVVLALKLQEFIAKAISSKEDRVQTGTFTHTIFSLHAFAKDLEGVF